MKQLSSILSPKGAMVLRVLLQYSSRLKGSEGSVLSMKVIETSFKNPLRSGLEKCLKRCSCIHASER